MCETVVFCTHHSEDYFPGVDLTGIARPVAATFFDFGEFGLDRLTVTAHEGGNGPNVCRAMAVTAEILGRNPIVHAGGWIPLSNLDQFSRAYTQAGAKPSLLRGVRGALNPEGAVRKNVYFQFEGQEVCHKQPGDLLVTEEDVKAALDGLRAQLRTGDLLVLTGSRPSKTFSYQFWPDAIRIAHQCGAEVWLDAPADVLAAVYSSERLGHPELLPDGVNANDDESRALFGCDPVNLVDRVHHARRVMPHGYMFIGLGADGAQVVYPDGRSTHFNLDLPGPALTWCACGDTKFGVAAAYRAIHSRFDDIGGALSTTGAVLNTQGGKGGQFDPALAKKQFFEVRVTQVTPVAPL